MQANLRRQTLANLQLRLFDSSTFLFYPRSFRRVFGFLVNCQGNRFEETAILVLFLEENGSGVAYVAREDEIVVEEDCYASGTG